MEQLLTVIGLLDDASMQLLNEDDVESWMTLNGLYLCSAFRSFVTEVKDKKLQQVMFGFFIQMAHRRHKENPESKLSTRDIHKISDEAMVRAAFERKEYLSSQAVQTKNADLKKVEDLSYVVDQFVNNVGHLIEFNDKSRCDDVTVSKYADLVEALHLDPKATDYSPWQSNKMTQKAQKIRAFLADGVAHTAHLIFPSQVPNTPWKEAEAEQRTGKPTKDPKSHVDDSDSDDEDEDMEEHEEAEEKGEGKGDVSRKPSHGAIPRLRECVIRQGDWKATFAGSLDKKISLLLTDPPYNVLPESHSPHDRVPWSTVKEVFDSFTDDMMTDKAVVLVFCSPEMLGFLFQYWRDERKWYVNPKKLIWRIRRVRLPAHTFRTRNVPLSGHVDIFMASRVSPQFLHTNIEKSLMEGRYTDVIEWPGVGTTKERIFREGKNGREGILRIEQKPVGLLRELIWRYTEEDGCVADPFCGTGSTAAAALLNNRHCYACDTDAEVVQYALKRIQKLTQDIQSGAISCFSQAEKIPPTEKDHDLFRKALETSSGESLSEADPEPDATAEAGEEHARPTKKRKVSQKQSVPSESVHQSGGASAVSAVSRKGALSKGLLDEDDSP